MPTTLDCQTCGACCFSPWTGQGYVRLYNLDLARVHGRGLPVIHQLQDGDSPEVVPKLATKLVPAGRVCIAFEGEPGAACQCTIYTDRPNACRQVEPGSFTCRESRQRFGLPV